MQSPGGDGRQSEAARLTVTVVVPTYRRPERALACLEGLRAQERPADEVLVVVRNDDEETRAAVERWRAEHAHDVVSLVIVEVTRPGQIVAMNAGLAAATGDVVAFTDDDCVPRPDWLRWLMGHYRDERGGGVGGRDHIHHGEETVEGKVRAVGRYAWYGRPLGNHHLELVPAEPVGVDILKGANMSFRRALLGEGLDEALQLGSAQCNDLEASLRVRRKGYRLIYDPRAVVDHYPAERFGDSTRRYDEPHMLFAEGHNWMYATLKHAAAWQAPAVVAYGFLVGHTRAYGLARALVAMPRVGVRDAARRLWHSWRGKAAGMATLRRARRRK
jgi:cellulose synthase/poly-beta-1,6-N-acetylglucosamine synthase-like glycosyltransferase